MTYILKHLPEDFTVLEVPSRAWKDSGPFSIYRLTKRSLSTLEAVSSISKELRISRKLIGVAGLKDKHAVTTQYISMPSASVRGLQYTIGAASLEHVGFSDERLFPGCLTENKFRILVRNMDPESVRSVPRRIDAMINYFGSQRFSQRNVDIGRAVIKGDYKTAAGLIILSHPHLKQAAQQSPTDPLAVIKKVPATLLRLYLQAYQSWLWNTCVERYVSTSLFKQSGESDCEMVMPLIGFSVEAPEPIMKIVEEVMRDECIARSSFILRSLPSFGLEGGSRKVHVRVKDLDIGQAEPDECFPGRVKCAVNFTLPCGSYATECIRQMMDVKNA